MTTNHPESRRRPRLSVFLLASAAFLPSTAGAQVFAQGECSVSVLNQTAAVQADGTWDLPNVPANMGPVRARVNCVDGATTLSGSSDFFTVTADRMNAIPRVELGTGAPTPDSVTLVLEPTALSFPGETARATVTAFFADGTFRDVTAALEGTVYESSDPAVATVDADGLVTALASGRVLISALFDAILGAAAVTVVVSGDADGDGLPDDWEAANGLDPSDPADALEDRDRDGLSHIAEFGFGTSIDTPDTDGDGLADGEEVETTGTNPALFDTDGDGLSDGLEIELGTDPLDASSFDLSGAPFTDFSISPSSLVLVVDGLTLDESRQLTVTGTLADGTAVDLTPRSRGTQYLSSDLTVCNFGAEDGVVFAGRDGLCTVTATNNGFGATADVEVTTFNPIGRGVLELPGHANNVDVGEEGWVFVASGAAGLVVVDAADASFPRLAATLETPGNANDVKVSGGRAFVADGTAGLLVADVTDPAFPVVLGSLATPGEARDVALVDGLVLIAAGEAGLHVVDAGDPSAPVLLATLALPGVARGVDAENGLAVVAADAGGLHVVDLADPAGPVLLSSLATTEARDVDLVGETAWLADFSGGLRSIDLSEPAAPRIAATVPLRFGGIPQDVAVTIGAGRLFAFTAEVFFATATVPIVEVSDPANPLPRFVVDFNSELEGTGLAVDDHFVYLTAAKNADDTAATGESFLMTAQVFGFRDEAGLAPDALLVSPADGTEVAEGEPIFVEVEASDDVGILAVRVRLDGEVAAEDRNAPYRVQLAAPPAPAALTIDAEVIDFGGNKTATESVTVSVVAEARTSVIGSVADTGGAPVPGAAVSTNLGGAGTTDGGGFFRFDEVPAGEGDVVVFATAERGGEMLRGRSRPTAPVAGGFTDVGEIRVRRGGLFPGRKFSLYEPGDVERPSESEPFRLARGDFNGDGLTDWAGAGRAFKIGIFLGRGDGTFEPVRFVATAVRDTSDLAVADLDGDTLADLVAVHRNFDEVSVYLSRGDGTFDAVGGLPTGDQPEDPQVADFDLDGEPDLAVANSRSLDVSLYFGQGGGVLGPEMRLATGTTGAFLAADLDTDGRTDLVGSHGSDSTLRLFFGRGDGTFAAPVAVASGVPVQWIEYADADGDGIFDLLVRSGGTSSRGATLPGLGGGTFGAPILGAGSFNVFDFQTADLDLDGRLDQALLHLPSDRFFAVRVFLGDGSPFFEIHPGSARAIRFDDVDLDGFPDLVVGGGAGLKVFRGDGTGRFAAFRRHKPGSGDGMAAGDFNEDGIVDLVQSYSSSVFVHLGLPGADFAFPMEVPAAHAPFSNFFVAEATGDTHADVVTFLNAEIGVIPGRGDGTFDAPLTSVLPALVSAAAVGDFDGDGADDFVGIERGSPPREIVLAINRGNGLFDTVQTMPAGDVPSRLEPADFDGDGRLDLAVTSLSPRSVAVLLNQGGTFAPPLVHPLPNPPDVAAAVDANGDGLADLAVEGNGSPSDLRILLGRGDGTFTNGAVYLTDRRVARFPRRLVAVDVDQDGIEDLVLSHDVDDVEIFLGRGDGTFGSRQRYTTGAEPSSFFGPDVLVPADLDADGRVDFVVRSESVLHFLIRE